MEVNPNFSKRAQEDYELVQQAQKGDEMAFAQLMKRYRNKVYYMMLQNVNNPTDAEDLMIEAFGKAFKSIDKYSPKFAFSTWLYRIARNNYIDFIRRNHDGGITFEPNHEDYNQTATDDKVNANYLQIESADASPDEDLIRKQKESILKAIIKELKPRYRRLIEMRYYEEKSYEEIAEELQIQVGTLKAQLFRARELIYNILRNKKQNI